MKLDRMTWNINKDEDAVEKMNDRLKSFRIDVCDVVSIQEFNTGYHAYVVVWYKVNELFKGC
jgi:hypothetical protein